VSLSPVKAVKVFQALSHKS